MVDEKAVMGAVISIITGVIFLVISAGVLDIAYAIVQRITNAIISGTETQPLGATNTIVSNVNVILTVIGIVMLALGGGIMIKFLLDMTKSARALEGER